MRAVRFVVGASSIVAAGAIAVVAALLSTPGAAEGTGVTIPDNCLLNLDRCSQKVWRHDSFPHTGSQQSITFSDHLTLTCTSNGPNVARSCTLYDEEAKAYVGEDGELLPTPPNQPNGPGTQQAAAPPPPNQPDAP